VIVRASQGSIQLITQPDHAHLARRVMERCAPLAPRPQRAAILRAIAEHDNGWTEEDAAPRVNPTTGQIVDFVNAPAEVRQRVWPRGVARVADDPWAAALVAQHAVVVYDRFHSDPEWVPFFARMTGLRDEMMGASGGTLDDLALDYTFVRLADLISLTFCTGWTDEQGFGGWTVHLSGASVVVAPDPFNGAVIPLEITAKVIRHERYVSDHALRAALSEAESTMVRGVVIGGRPQLH
jgi:hypothetical protein